MSFAAELAAEGQQDATEHAAADAATQALAHAGVIELLAVDAASVFSRAYGDSPPGRSARRRRRRRARRARRLSGRELERQRGRSPSVRSCPTRAAGASSTSRRAQRPASTPTPRAPASRTSRARSRSSGRRHGVDRRRDRARRGQRRRDRGADRLPGLAGGRLLLGLPARPARRIRWLATARPASALATAPPAGAQPVMPPNIPPVMCSVWPCT